MLTIAIIILGPWFAALILAGTLEMVPLFFSSKSTFLNNWNTGRHFARDEKRSTSNVIKVSWRHMLGTFFGGVLLSIAIAFTIAQNIPLNEPLAFTFLGLGVENLIIGSIWIPIAFFSYVIFPTLSIALFRPFAMASLGKKVSKGNI